MAQFARIERQHQRNAAPLLAEHGLQLREWRMLAIIDELGTAGVTRLADEAVIDRSTIGKLLVRLQTKGLVLRMSTVDDGRASPTTLTEQGHELLARTAPLMRSLFERYRQQMAPGDYAELVKLTREFGRGVDRVAAQTLREDNDD